VKETNKCVDNGLHRYFALEYIGVEPAQKVLIPLVCTQCGELKKHLIDVAKEIQS
jgi:hypothetical protein